MVCLRQLLSGLPHHRPLIPISPPLTLYPPLTPPPSLSPRSTLQEDIDFVVTDVRNGDFEKDGNYDRVIVFKQV